MNESLDSSPKPLVVSNEPHSVPVATSDSHLMRLKLPPAVPPVAFNAVQASFCLAGGVLPTLNMDKLPVPLPDALLLG